MDSAALTALIKRAMDSMNRKVYRQLAVHLSNFLPSNFPSLITETYSKNNAKRLTLFLFGNEANLRQSLTKHTELLIVEMIRSSQIDYRFSVIIRQYARELIETQFTIIKMGLFEKALEMETRSNEILASNIRKMADVKDSCGDSWFIASQIRPDALFKVQDFFAVALQNAGEAMDVPAWIEEAKQRPKGRTKCSDFEAYGWCPSVDTCSYGHVPKKRRRT